MARIETGPQWRRYSFDGGPKVVAMMACLIVFFVAVAVYGPARGDRHANSIPYVSVAGITLSASLMVFAAFRRRWVFVDAAGGFVAVHASWLGFGGDRTTPMGRVLGVEAYVTKSSRGTFEYLRLGLTVEGDPARIWLSDFKTRAQLTAEAHALGELIARPVHISPEAAS